MSCIEIEVARRAHGARALRAALSAAAAAVLAACSHAPAPQAPQAAPAPARTVTAPTAAPSYSARNWDDYKLQAARRIVAAHPQQSYMGVPPEPLLAVPVLEVELNGDGSVRRIVTLREPSQARDTTQIAVDAIRRAAPYGDVSRLPKPWKFTEAFLFDDNRRFKPRTLDQ